MPKVNGCQRDDERPETAVDALPKYRRGGSAQEIGGQFQPYPVAMALRRHSAAEGSAQRSSRLSSATPGVPDEVVRVLSVLPSASLVVSPDGTVLRASTRAMALGLVNRSSVAVPEIAELVAKVADDGNAREQEMRVRRPPLGRELLELRARVATLGTGAILVLIDDLADERRVEAVRRDFVANVSHELKTPVGALSLLAEAILAGADDEDQVRHFAERMQYEATRLSALIQDVIDLSRLQSDDPLTHAEVINIDDLIGRALEEIRVLAGTRNIEVIVGDPSGALIYGDRIQLLTALRNLLVNAVAYSPDHTRISVTGWERDGIVEIAVKDQGEGIAAHDLDRIFERFYRADPARSRMTGGTGLGLAIVKHVCQNHGGEVTVWSEVGTGSTFTLRIPAYDDDTQRVSEAHALPVDLVTIPNGGTS